MENWIISEYRLAYFLLYITMMVNGCLEISLSFTMYLERCCDQHVLSALVVLPLVGSLNLPFSA